MKKTLLAASMPVHATLCTEASGHFRFEAFKPDAEGNEIPGTRRIAADWFDNLITDAGLDLLATTWPDTATSACRVGTGSTTPAVTDTGLVSHLAATTTRVAQSTGTAGTAPYYGWRRKTMRFALGAVVGNVAEVGMFSELTGGTMFSRALIEAGGVPTTITILADEQLDVVYELRYYAQPADVAWGPVTISGVDYSGTIRASTVTRADDYHNSLIPGSGNLNGGRTGVIQWCTNGCGSGYTTLKETATLATITSEPAGARGDSSSVTATTYVSGTYYMDHNVGWGLTNGNFATGAGSLFVTTSFGLYQLNFSPKIPKDGTKVLNLYIRVSWGRKTI